MSFSRLSRVFSAVLILLASSFLFRVDCAYAAFHLADIDEVMVSYGGDSDVQFVEIVMLVGGQGVVGGSVLGAFDDTGAFIGVVLAPVPTGVAGGADRRWIMATPEFETVSGLTADFTFPGGLPVGGGMVCWGKPPVTSIPSGYIDCVAYGSYSGPTNGHIGVPTALLAEGHSLVRTSDTNNSNVDFACGDPATPENNAFQTVVMAATTPCPVCGNDANEEAEQCDGTDDAACPGDCLPSCICAVCGDGAVNAGGEVCDGGDDAACPGQCTDTCSCAVCGDNVAESPVETCDGTDDSACPGNCLPPANPDECQCPFGDLDEFACYKAKGKVTFLASVADVFDATTVESKGAKFHCNPAEIIDAGTDDVDTHIVAYKIKSPHVKQTGLDVTDNFGTFTYDTKKAQLLMVPAAKSIAPDPAPGLPNPTAGVDRYRCVKIKASKGATKFPKGIFAAVTDQFITSIAAGEIKKPSQLCVATDKDGAGIIRPGVHLMCYKIKPIKVAVVGVQTNDEIGALTFDVKKAQEVCYPASLP
jgi:hypothetical protein